MVAGWVQDLTVQFEAFAVVLEVRQIPLEVRFHQDRLDWRVIHEGHCPKHLVFCVDLFVHEIGVLFDPGLQTQYGIVFSAVIEEYVPHIV